MRPGDKIDNDCDGRVDEEAANGVDDDMDMRVDEDLAIAPVGQKYILVRSPFTRTLLRILANGYMSWF